MPSYETIAQALLKRMKDSGFMKFTAERQPIYNKLMENRTDPIAERQLANLTNRWSSLVPEDRLTQNPYHDAQILHGALRDRFTPQYQALRDKLMNTDKLDNAMKTTAPDGQYWNNQANIGLDSGMPDPGTSAFNDIKHAGRQAVKDRLAGKALGTAGTGFGLSELYDQLSGDGQAQAASPAAYKKLFGFIPGSLAGKLQTQDILGNLMKKDYPNLVEKGSYGGQSLENKILEKASVAADLRDNLNPKYAADLLPFEGRLRGETPEETQALLRWKSVNEPEFLGRNYTSDNVDKIKKWAGIGSVAGLMAGYNPAESEAFPMPKDVRAAYNAARKALRDAGKDDKPLYHWSRNLDEMTKNPKVDQEVPVSLDDYWSAPYKQNEPWKPPSIYASENLGENLMSRVGEWGTLDLIKAEMRREKNGPEGFARILRGEKYKSKTLNEDDLIDAMEDGKSLKPLWGKNDGIKLTNADGEGLTEYLIRNPNAVQIFSDKGMWPKAGVAAGSIAGLLGMSNDAEAASPKQWAELAKLGIKRPQERVTQDVLGDVLHKRRDIDEYYRLADLPKANKYNRPDYAQDWAEAQSAKLLHAREQSPTSIRDPIASLEDAAQRIDFTSEEAKAVIRHRSVYDEEQLKRYFTSQDYDAVKRWAGIPALAASVLGLTANDSEAMPLGPWKKASQKIMDSGTRTEDAFYRMLGHKFHTSTDNPKEVVDVIRSKNGQDFHVVTKGADGERYVLPMTKDYLEALSAAKGTQEQLSKLPTLSAREKDLQVMKSATMRENKKASQLSPITNRDYRGWTAGGKEMVREMDPDLVHDYIHVYNEADELIYMPKAYADILVKRKMYTYSPKNKKKKKTP